MLEDFSGQKKRKQQARQENGLHESARPTSRRFVGLFYMGKFLLKLSQEEQPTVERPPSSLVPLIEPSLGQVCAQSEIKKLAPPAIGPNWRRERDILQPQSINKWLLARRGNGREILGTWRKVRLVRACVSLSRRRRLWASLPKTKPLWRPRATMLTPPTERRLIQAKSSSLSSPTATTTTTRAPWRQPTTIADRPTDRSTDD